MTHYTLAEIAAKLARLDGIEDVDHAPFEKGLRNLVQRHFLPPTTQQGRVFLYDNAAAVTIRLAQIAAEFGLPRTMIDNVSRWLTNSGARRSAIPQGGYVGTSHAQEAIDRARAGEVFAIHIVMRADRTVSAQADWVADHAPNKRVMNAAIDAGIVNTSPEIARFSLPASHLIAEILPLLGKD